MLEAEYDPIQIVTSKELIEFLISDPDDYSCGRIAMEHVEKNKILIENKIQESKSRLRKISFDLERQEKILYQLRIMIIGIEPITFFNNNDMCSEINDNLS